MKIIEALKRYPYIARKAWTDGMYVCADKNLAIVCKLDDTTLPLFYQDCLAEDWEEAFPFLSNPKQAVQNGCSITREDMDGYVTAQKLQIFVNTTKDPHFNQVELTNKFDWVYFKWCNEILVDFFFTLEDDGKWKLC